MNRHLNLVKESDIEAKLKRAVEAIGGMRLKFVSPGRPGVPDNIVIMRTDRFYLVECKRPKGGTYSVLQIKFYDDIFKQGVIIHHVYNDDTLRHFINYIK